MIKQLQKKFVFTAMAAVGILLIILIGTINTANLIMTENKIKSTLSVISSGRGKAGVIPELPDNADIDKKPPEFSMRSPKNEYDTFMSSTFFEVSFNDGGQVVFTDVSRTSTVTEEDAQKLALQAVEKGEYSGRNGKYRYVVSRDMQKLGCTVVFLDISDEISSCIQIAALSCAVALVCQAIMLLFVFLLSKKAILPIAENIERQKQFVTNAGHEIKTPLAIIQSNTEAMELYNGENKWSKNIKAQTERLAELMNQLLALSRTDEGVLQNQAADFSFGELINEVMLGFLQPMEMKNIELKSEIEPDIILNADKAQISRLLSVLYDNAVKYADNNGKIAVKLQKKERHIVFTIENTCEKVPNVPAKKLFERFYRGDDARTQKSGGTGIGLSVADAIARANNGTISAEYIGENIIKFKVKF